MKDGSDFAEERIKKDIDDFGLPIFHNAIIAMCIRFCVFRSSSRQPQQKTTQWQPQQSRRERECSCFNLGVAMKVAEFRWTATWVTQIVLLYLQPSF